MTVNRIDAAFTRLRAGGRKGLIPFLAAGDPSLDMTAGLIAECEAQGADLVEIGVPFSDPLADGPVNQRAYQRALAGGASLLRTLELVAAVRRRSQLPLVLMSYLNPVQRFGFDKFAASARDAGLDGLILSDAPPEETVGFRKQLQAAGIHSVLLVAPTSPAPRISLIAGDAQGYIYYVSLRGVTGPREQLPTDLVAGLARVRAIAALPIAVGFGISTPTQAAEVAALADAVIVGSALVATLERASGDRDAVAQVGRFLHDFRSAIG